MEHKYPETAVLKPVQTPTGPEQKVLSLWERVWTFLSRNCRLDINGLNGSASLYVRTPKGKDFQILLSEGQDVQG